MSREYSVTIRIRNFEEFNDKTVIVYAYTAQDAAYQATIENPNATVVKVEPLV